MVFEKIEGKDTELATITKTYLALFYCQDNSHQKA